MFPRFLDQPSSVVAKKLIGCYLHREIDGEVLVARIVETESYDEHDMASHTYNGKTPRNEVMFGPAGFLYVYFTYGMHYCCNVVTGSEGEGSAVLIRAVEPVRGRDSMERLRKKTGEELSNGPAKLCQALRIDIALNAHDLQQSPLKLFQGESVAVNLIAETPRIGVSKAKAELRRFYLKGNPYVSHP